MTSDSFLYQTESADTARFQLVTSARFSVTQEAAGSSPVAPAISESRIKLLCYRVSFEVPVRFKLVCRRLGRWPGGFRAQEKRYDREQQDPEGTFQRRRSVNDITPSARSGGVSPAGSQAFLCM